MSKYVGNPFANKALELAYAPEIDDLNRRIVRRKELVRVFRIDLMLAYSYGLPTAQ